MRPEPSALEHRRIVILGAGPTGLGAAYRLAELGCRNFTVYERNSYAGGLAASFADPRGFTWDVGGHVQFSHYAYFDAAMDVTMGQDWLTHARESWIWIRDRFIPYPFQNNIHFLPEREQRECVIGLLRRPSADGPAPGDFAEWIRMNFGDGIANVFMLPYNQKVWAYPATDLDYAWIGERVAVVDLERIIVNLIDRRPDAAWGPNNRFRFPAEGGTGEIWRRMAAALPTDTIRYGADACSINLRDQSIQFADGGRERYDVLISTIPLTTLIGMADDASLGPAANCLKYSTVHVVGIGLAGSAPPHLATKCWIYYPENTAPFYRLTVFSNYSPRNVPDPARHWSVMVEVSESPVKPVDAAGLLDAVIDGLLATGVIASKNDIVSCWQHTADHGYPTPFLKRDEIVMPLLQQLQAHHVFSRGRFGAWKYEVSNQDHSFMQGVEVANHLAFGSEEITLHRPNVVNASRR